MAVLTIASLAGSPGVTTAATAIAANWPRPVLLIEADTSAASTMMAGFFRSNLRTTAGGIEKLAFALARNALRAEDIFDPELALAIAVHDLPSIPSTPIPAIAADHRMWVVPGFSNLRVADGARALWSRLPALFDELDEAGFDVILDLGRIGIDDPRLTLIDTADHVLFCATATMVDLNRCYRRLELPDLAQRFPRNGVSNRVSMLLNEPIAEEHSRKEFATHLLPVMGTLPYDPLGAAVFTVGKPDPKPSRNSYRSAARRAATDLAAALERSKQVKAS